MKEVSKRRKVIGYWTLGSLIFCILLFLFFHSVLNFSRSVGDSFFTKEQEQKIRQELIEQGLPTSQREAKEREYKSQYNTLDAEETNND